MNSFYQQKDVLGKLLACVPPSSVVLKSFKETYLSGSTTVLLAFCSTVMFCMISSQGVLHSILNPGSRNH